MLVPRSLRERLERVDLLNIGSEFMQNQWGAEAHKTADNSRSPDSFACVLVLLPHRIDRRSLLAR